MVAGRQLGSVGEQQTARHQADRRGQLEVEAALEDRVGARVAGRLDFRVEAGRQVDQEDDREAEQAEREDEAPQPRPPPAQGDHGKRGG